MGDIASFTPEITDFQASDMLLVQRGSNFGFIQRSNLIPAATMKRFTAAIVGGTNNYNAASLDGRSVTWTIVTNVLLLISFDITNSGSITINLDSQASSKTGKFYNYSGTKQTIPKGFIVPGVIYQFMYDGTDLVLLNIPLSEMLFEARLAITSAQFKASFTTPLDLIAAPGSGYLIKIVDNPIARLIYGTVAYVKNDANSHLVVAYDTDSSYEYKLLAANYENTSTKNYEMVNIGASGAQNQLLDNKKMVVKTLVGNPITGDGTINIYATFRIVGL